MKKKKRKNADIVQNACAWGRGNAKFEQYEFHASSLTMYVCFLPIGGEGMGGGLPKADNRRFFFTIFP